MNKMIETVGGAMVNEITKITGQKMWDDLPAEARIQIRDQFGVSAISAMSMPTVYMDEAPTRDKIEGVGSFTARQIWSSMIQAALSEKS